MKIGDALRKVEKTLPGDTPSLDGQVLLAHILNKPRAWLLAHLDEVLDAQLVTDFERAAQRLISGEPLPYVLGHWEFYGLDFIVTPDVLIPRPETELLVDKARAWLAAHPAFDFALDVGTGSGCIPVALAHSTPRLSLIATDISAPALDVARRNAARHGVDRQIHFIQCDLLPEVAQMDIENPVIARRLQGNINLITANLPYIPSSKVPRLEIYGKEPLLALDGGEDGLVLIRRLLERVPQILAPGGLILLEIESGQGHAAFSLAGKFYEQAKISLHKDLSGNDRLIEIQT